MSSVTNTLDFVFNILSSLRPQGSVPQQPTTSSYASSHVRPRLEINHVNDEHTAPNLLSQLSPDDTRTAKNIFLTLHFLFPHELLPALDLLDRKLVTMLHFDHGSQHEIFYVQSASAQSTNPSHVTPRADKQPRYYDARRNAKATDTYYEVRLDSWSCSCAGFAFDGFKVLDVEERAGGEDVRDESGFDGQKMREVVEETGGEVDARLREGDGTDFEFGGLATVKTEIVPICKHILAVSLAKAAPEVFGNCVKMKEVSKEEIAGCGAGYGDHG